MFYDQPGIGTVLGETRVDSCFSGFSPRGLELWLGHLRGSTCLARCLHHIAQHIQWFSAQDGQCLPTQPFWQSVLSSVQVHKGLRRCQAVVYFLALLTFGGLPGPGPPEVKRPPSTHYCIVQHVFEC